MQANSWDRMNSAFIQWIYYLDHWDKKIMQKACLLSLFLLSSVAVLSLHADKNTAARIKCWKSNSPGMSQYSGMKSANFHEGATGSFLFPPAGQSTFNFTVRKSVSGAVEVTPGEGLGWHILNEDCMLHDLLSDSAIKEHIVDKAQDTHGILYLGDSISNFESLGLCELLHLKAGSQENPSQVKNWWPGNWNGTKLGLFRDRYFHHYGPDLNHCETPGGLKVANMFLVGLNEDPPWWMSQCCGPEYRIKEAARQWRDGIGRDMENKPFTIPGAPFRPPTLVLLSSAIWDQSGAFMRKEFLNDTNRAVKVLPGRWLREWEANFTRVSHLL